MSQIPLLDTLHARHDEAPVVPLRDTAVGTVRPMRLHIQLDDDLVAELDRRAGRRRRSAFIAELIRHALDDARRWDDIEAALGSLADAGHAWDEDPAAWVRAQRGSDVRRAG